MSKLARRAFSGGTACTSHQEGSDQTAQSGVPVPGMLLHFPLYNPHDELSIVNYLFFLEAAPVLRDGAEKGDPLGTPGARADWETRCAQHDRIDGPVSDERARDTPASQARGQETSHTPCSGRTSRISTEDLNDSPGGCCSAHAYQGPDLALPRIANRQDRHKGGRLAMRAM